MITDPLISTVVIPYCLEDIMLTAVAVGDTGLESTPLHWSLAGILLKDSQQC